MQIQHSFRTLHCRGLFRDDVTKYLATVLTLGSVSLAVHKEFGNFTIRHYVPTVDDECRRWQRLCHCGVPLYLIPTKQIAVEIAETILREVDDGASIIAAVAFIAAHWHEYMSQALEPEEVKTWTEWSKDVVERVNRKARETGEKG